MMKNVLLSSGGNKDSLALEVRSQLEHLGDGKLIVGDVSTAISSRYVGDDFWEMPIADDVNFENLLKGLMRHKIGLVIPTRDGELAFWAANRRQFEKCGVKVSVSSLGAIQTCLDKVAFFNFAKACGEEAVPTYTELEAVPSQRLVVKERFGSGSRLAYLDVSRSAARTHSLTLSSPIFQPFIAGREVSADTWVSKNQSEVRTSLRFREVVHQGESIVTRTFQNAELEKSVNRILSSLAKNFGIKGAFTTQLILPPEGDPLLLEINPRIGGASLSSKAIGHESMLWTLIDEHLSRKELPKFERADFEVRVIRSRASIVERLPRS